MTLRPRSQRCNGVPSKQDVSRRDFTINTLAIHFNAPRFGELMDLHGGRRDLQNKTIRVLHGLSFIDDPTRIFVPSALSNAWVFNWIEYGHPDERGGENGILTPPLPSRLSAELLHVLSERETGKTLAD